MGLNVKEREHETVDQKCGHAVAYILAIEYRCLAQVFVFRGFRPLVPRDAGVQTKLTKARAIILQKASLS
ncbi:hypothetical protein CFP56_033219 [Quercus suber]|uniref:Uncharacterized protein n=1 Tax=Quercus suber TaxID=58331 RepID=A0AAW0MBV5_QUESU